jgi:hypothetical protein
LSGCPVVRLSGCPVVRLSGCPVVRLSGCPVVLNYTKIATLFETKTLLI